jgi:hypothetical protein
MMIVPESPRYLVLYVKERIICPPRVSHLPIMELVGDDRRNMPCAILQLRCTPCSSSGGAVGQPRHSRSAEEICR